MAMSSWQDALRSARKTALVQDGRKKVHYLFKDGREMTEEYELKTNDLLVRKWKKKSVLGGEGKWEFEIGEPLSQVSLETVSLRESSSNPMLSRKDTKLAFQWRIRNLPYPIDTYDVTVDRENKYKKPQEILDMEKTLIEELKKLKASKDGDVECNPS